MPEWLQGSLQQEQLAVSVLLLRLVAALVLGCVVAGIFRLTLANGREQAPGLMATLVMLTVLIAMVTLVIANSANSVALAFSLVGALSIVRFRTVVEDTRDTAFVIFAVAVGMAAGAGFMTVLLVGIPVTTIAAVLFRPRRREGGSPECVLSVRVGTGQDPQALLRVPFEKHLERYSLKSTATARQGAAIELTYAVRVRAESTPLILISDLNGVEGIQSVELRTKQQN